MHKNKKYVSPTAKTVKVKSGQLLMASGAPGTRNAYESGGDAWSETGTGASRSSYESGGDVWE